jgi:ABC-2 type transport system ATP-binding protein
MLLIENVSKQFGSTKAVKEVSFTVEKGASYGLLGPNGAGKSTTIQMIAGLTSPSSGTVMIGPHRLDEERRQAQMLLGVVPQEIALYLYASAEENLRFWGRMYNLSGKKLSKRVDEVLEIVGLQERRKGRIETFSGGMKRRINIAAALLHEPQLLIMDEPTVGIDPQSRNHILETVKWLNEQGMTVIYTSHYMEEVQFLCQRVGIMDHGRLIANGSIQDIRQHFGELSEVFIEYGQKRVEDPTHPDQIKDILSPFSVREVMVKEKEIILHHSNPEELIGTLISKLDDIGLKFRGIHIKEPNLESVFLQLTGRELRDD